MEKQPFLLVVLNTDERKLINERQIVSVEEYEDGLAYIRMSNGDELIVKEPTYGEWENDYHTRKY